MITGINLIWITPKAAETIVYCARVSNPKNQETNNSPERLIQYLVRHKHWSPFEMASMCVEINTTRDISAQILRHRSFSFQEFSQRYSSTDLLGKAEVPELRQQDLTNRQNSIDGLSDEEKCYFSGKIADLYYRSDKLYQEMLDNGIAKECARKILPLNSPTRLYMSGTIRSWIHYVHVRGNSDTQLEHRQIALAVKSLLIEQLPALTDVIDP